MKTTGWVEINFCPPNLFYNDAVKNYLFILILGCSTIISDTYHIFGLNVGGDLLPELVGCGQEDQQVDHELRVDEHVTDDDQDGGQDPTVETNHQHSGNI